MAITEIKLSISVRWWLKCILAALIVTNRITGYQPSDALMRRLCSRGVVVRDAP